MGHPFPQPAGVGRPQRSTGSWSRTRQRWSNWLPQLLTTVALLMRLSAHGRRAVVDGGARPMTPASDFWLNYYLGIAACREAKQPGEAVGYFRAAARGFRRIPSPPTSRSATPCWTSTRSMTRIRAYPPGTRKLDDRVAPGLRQPRHCPVLQTGKWTRRSRPTSGPSNSPPSFPPAYANPRPRPLDAKGRKDEAIVAYRRAMELNSARHQRPQQPRHVAARPATDYAEGGADVSQGHRHRRQAVRDSRQPRPRPSGCGHDRPEAIGRNSVGPSSTSTPRTPVPTAVWG